MDWLQLNVADLDSVSHLIESVSIQTGRNLTGFRFCTACSREERREVERILVQSLSELHDGFAGEYLPLRGSISCPSVPGGMCSESEQKLHEAGILFASPDSDVLLSAGFGRDWPDARGVYANLTSDGYRFTACVNSIDHIRFEVAQSGSELCEVFREVCAAESILNQALVQQGHEFARSAALGFLGALPSDIGTNLSVAAKVKLPIGNARPEIKKLCQDLNLEARYHGCDCLELIMQSKMGVSEVAQINAFSSALKKMASSLI